MSTLNLTGSGLIEMGHCPIVPSDGLSHESGTLVLLGPDEPAFWPMFIQTPEYNDNAPDPMDRWSRRTIDDIAALGNGAAYYPFGGEPFLPFYTWALRTGQAWASPIGFLVHKNAGLFASYRGAVWVAEDRPVQAAIQPCLTCDAPCKTACPVDAFAQGYDVVVCKSHLNTPQGASCLSDGCKARRACPVGAGLRLPAQAAFHMEAFR
ncbi:MAG: epoxyqueuosine reductase [Reinekea sp.]